jgi:hypothetical protein
MLRALRAALDAAETDLAITLADLDNSGATSVEIAAERDAALAARDAAWRAGRDAAADAVAPKRDKPCDCDGHDCYCQNPGNTEAVAAWTAERHAELLIRALQPPAEMAAEAPGDAVAKEREACAEIAETVMRDADENCRANRFGGYTHSEAAAAQAAQEIAAAIRARAGA